MTDDAIVSAFAALRAQVGAMQGTIDMLAHVVSERLADAAPAAPVECQHPDVEDIGSTLRTKRVRCTRCKKVIEEPQGGESNT